MRAPDSHGQCRCPSSSRLLPRSLALACLSSRPQHPGSWKSREPYCTPSSLSRLLIQSLTLSSTPSVKARTRSSRFPSRRRPGLVGRLTDRQFPALRCLQLDPITIVAQFIARIGTTFPDLIVFRTLWSCCVWEVAVAAVTVVSRSNSTVLCPKSKP